MCIRDRRVGAREVRSDCIYVNNVQLLAHIPVAINAPEGATEARVTVQYYARDAEERGGRV